MTNDRPYEISLKSEDIKGQAREQENCEVALQSETYQTIQMQVKGIGEAPWIGGPYIEHYIIKCSLLYFSIDLFSSGLALKRDSILELAIIERVLALVRTLK